MKKVINSLFYFLILILPFVFTAVNEELFEFNKMLIIYTFTIIIGFFWILGVLQQEIKLKASALQLPLMFFLFSQIMSTIFSIHPRTSVFGYYTRLNGGLLSTLSYSFLFMVFTTSIEKKQFKNFISTLLVSGLLISLYAIPEHFGHSLSCLFITKKFDVSCWVQDVQNRVFASFGQPNWLAAYLIMLIPLAIHTFETNWPAKKEQLKTDLQRTKLKAGLAFVSANLMFLSLLFSKSRSALLGLGLGLTIYYALNFFNLIKEKHSVTKIFSDKKNKKLLLIPVSFAALLLTFGSIYSPNLKQIWQKLTHPSATNKTAISANNPNAESNPSSQDPGGTESGEIRKIVWQGALAIAKRYPIFGSGVETFAYSYYQDRPMIHNLVSEWDFLYNKAHNEYLNFLATTGGIGLSAYLIFTLYPLYLALKIKNENLAYSLIAGLVALYVSNFFGFSTVVVSFLMFIYLGMIAVLDSENPENSKNFAKNKNRQTSPKKLILLERFFKTLKLIPFEISSLLLLVSALLLIINVSRIWKADAAYAKGKQLARAGQYTKGLEELQLAVELAPQEALFYDELANTYTKIAVDFAQLEKTDESREFEQAAIDAINATLLLNPRQLNFHKSKIRNLINLAVLNPEYLVKAESATKTALELAPSDAKLMFNLGLIQSARGKTEASLNSWQKAVEMKANYYDAILQLAKSYESQTRYDQALDYYQQLYQALPGDPQLKEKIEQLEASLSASVK